MPYLLKVRLGVLPMLTLALLRLYVSLKSPKVTVHIVFSILKCWDLRSLRMYTHLITCTHFHFTFLLKQFHLPLVRDLLNFEFLIILLFLSLIL